jgi:hypothetical protein
LPLLDIGADDITGAAMRIDMVRTILRVVLEHEDERIQLIWAVCNLLDQQTDRVIVVRLLQLLKLLDSSRMALPRQRVRVWFDSDMVGGLVRAELATAERETMKVGARRLRSFAFGSRPLAGSVADQGEELHDRQRGGGAGA